MLTTPLVVGCQACLVAGSDLAHLYSSRELGRKITNQFTEVNSFFSHVVEGDDFAPENRLRSNVLQLDVVEGDQFLEDSFVSLQLGLLLLMGMQVLGRCNSEHPTLRMKRIVLATRPIDVVQHLLAGYRFATPGVRTACRYGLGQFHAPVCPYDEFRTTPGFQIEGIPVFPDHLHVPEPDDDALGRLDCSMLLLEGQGIAVRRIGIRFKDGQWGNGH